MNETVDICKDSREQPICNPYQCDRELILSAAMQCICKDREDLYGSPKESFEKTAKLWSAYIGFGISAEDVAIMMTLLKISRISTGKTNYDNYIDAAGYIAIAGEVKK